MSERSGDELRLRIEASSTDVIALAGYAPFAVGRSADGERAAGAFLVRGLHRVEDDVCVPASDCLPLPSDIESAAGVLVPAAASALALWESVGLELGDAAAWTAAGTLSPLVGQMALWNGVCPGIELGAAATPFQFDPNQVERVDWSDQEAAAVTLAKLIESRPGFAAVELSGRAEVIDMFLEVVPRWGRLVLAGPPGLPVTIDFYKNVHRKGIVIRSTIVEPSRVFVSGSEVQRQLRRACGILRNHAMATRCWALAGPSIARESRVLAT